MHDEDSASKVSKGKADENASIAAPESVMEKEEEKDHVPKKRPEWKIKTEKFLDNYIVIIFMMVVTVYALFFDDVRILALPPSTDEGNADDKQEGCLRVALCEVERLLVRVHLQPPQTPAGG